MFYDYNYLEHYGILGQKWGVRRFQNPDGTLTEEGKKRYNDDTPESETWKKDEAKKLSDEELRRRNNRLQSERQYRDLTTSQAEKDRAQMKNEIKKDFLKKALLIPVGAVLAYAGTKLIKNNGTKIVDLMERYGKKALSKIRTNKLLKQASIRGHEKYLKEHRLKQFMPRPGRSERNRRVFNYYPKGQGAVPRGRIWPNIPIDIVRNKG